MLEMFVIRYTSMWPNFILIVLRIQRAKAQKWAKVSLPLCSSVYDDVTDFAICGFYKNTKVKISPERNIFSSNKKKSLITHQGLRYGKKYFFSGGNL